MKYIVINPNKTADWIGGKWTTQNYILLINMILKELNHKVYLVGDSSEFDSNELIKKNYFKNERVVNIAGKYKIDEFIDFIKRSEVVITADTGIMHISNFLNIKTIALFFFTDPEIYSHRNSNTIIIFNKYMKCMPCIKFQNIPVDNYPFKCKYNYECSKSISTIEVFSALLKLLNHA